MFSKNTPGASGCSRHLDFCPNVVVKSRRLSSICLTPATKPHPRRGSSRTCERRVGSPPSLLPPWSPNTERVILALGKRLETKKPCRPRQFRKPGIMVSLWPGKVIQGFRGISDSEWWTLERERVSLKKNNAAINLVPLEKAVVAAATSCLAILESIWHHLNYLYTQLYLMMIKAADSRAAHCRHWRLRGH